MAETFIIIGHPAAHFVYVDTILFGRMFVFAQTLCGGVFDQKSINPRLVLVRKVQVKFVINPLDRCLWIGDHILVCEINYPSFNRRIGPCR